MDRWPEDGTTLLEALGQLGPIHDYMFSARAQVLARRSNEIELQGILKDSPPDTVRFAALYTLLIRLYSYEKLDAYRAAYEQGVERFHDEMIDLGLDAQFLRTKGEFEAALEKAKAWKNRLPEHPWAQHSYADLVACMAERDRERGSVYLKPDGQEFADALVAADAAIDLEARLSKGYPEMTSGGWFLRTTARLLALQERFPQAERALDLAVIRERSTEDTTLRAERVGQYNDLRMQIRLQQQAVRLDQNLQQFRSEEDRTHREADRRLAEANLEVERKLAGVGQELDRKLAGAKAETVQLLALLAAVITFLVTGVQIETKFSVRGAIRLTFVITGSILVIFAAFNILFSADQPRLARRGTARYFTIGLGVFLMLLGGVILHS